MTVHWVLLATLRAEIIITNVNRFGYKDQLPLPCFSPVLRDPEVVTSRMPQ